MNFLNKAQLIGNLAADPELRKTQGGQSVCTLRVATNRQWTDKEGVRHDEAEFHSVVVWGKLAEICEQYLKKGNKVYFEGRLQTRNWEDDAGVKHYRTEIVAQDMIMLTPKGQSGDYDGGGKAPEAAAPKKTPAATEEASAEDLPF